MPGCNKHIGVIYFVIFDETAVATKSIRNIAYINTLVICRSISFVDSTPVFLN